MSLYFNTYENFVTKQFMRRPVTVGKIGGVYGILGWIKIISFTDKLDSIFTYNPWFIYLDLHWKLIYLDRWCFLGKHYIAKIKNISNRESAQSLVHGLIAVDAQIFPPLELGEYYCKDLIGCAVMIDHKKLLGYVIKIIETTANDVLVVSMNKKNGINKIKEYLIPFVEEKVIKQVDLKSRIIIVDWDINF